MPVDTRHPDYNAMADFWQRCRDVHAGADAVKAQKTKYLPLLEGHTSENDKGYIAYLQRAMFFPALERTVAGLIGTTLRKPPVVRAPENVASLKDDIMLTQDTFVGALVRVLDELFTVGRWGVFVDWAEAEERPYWSEYTAEKIINWREEKIGGVRKLVHLVLQEDEPDPANMDPFKTQQRTKYREIIRLPEGVWSREWRKGQVVQGRPDDWIATDIGLMKRRGTPLTDIPFVCINPRSLGLSVEKPPLLDLADLNLSHYRSSADLEHGRHFTALPTPYVTGWAGDTSGNALAIGAGTAWLIPSEQAKVGMLEFTGQGLQSLRQALEDKERLMAVVGTRLLEEQPRSAETAEAVRLRQAGELASLGTMITTVSAGLSLAMQWFAFWLGVDAIGDDKIGVSLSTDFISARLTAQEVQALVAAWQAGAISYPTLYWNMQQGEWTRPEVEWEDEQQQIEDDEMLSEATAEPLPAGQPPVPGSPASMPMDEEDMMGGEPAEA